MTRPAASLIGITSRALLRVDRGRDGGVSASEQVRPEVDDLAVLVDAALRLGSRPARDVWVLSSDLWTQSVALPAASTLTATPAELAQALRHESEPLSGLSAFEAELGFLPLGSRGAEREFWVTQVARSQLEAAEEVARRLGCRLRGLAHPAGLPRPLNGASPGEPWERLELWPGLALELQGDGQEVRLHLDAERGGRGLLPDPAIHAELLVADGALTPPETGEEVYRLELADPEQLRGYLAQWVSALAGRVAVPWVAPAPKPLTREARTRAALGLACVTLIACYGHYGWLGEQKEAVAQQLERAKAPAEEAARLQRELEAKGKEQQRLEEEGARLRAGMALYRQALVAHRQRHQRLLGTLARAPEGLVVDILAASGPDTIVHGLADGPELPTQLASLLASELQGLGWRVDAPITDALRRRSDGGPWAFELHLRDAPLPAPPVPAAGGGK